MLLQVDKSVTETLVGDPNIIVVIDCQGSTTNHRDCTGSHQGLDCKRGGAVLVTDTHLNTVSGVNRRDNSYVVPVNLNIYVLRCSTWGVYVYLSCPATAYSVKVPPRRRRASHNNMWLVVSINSNSNRRIATGVGNLLVPEGICRG